MKLNTHLLVGFFALLFLVMNSAVAECFTGKWKSYNPDLLLELKQQRQQISGSHLIVVQQGGKIDASEDEKDQTISGTIVGDVAHVKFLSSFGGIGQATIVCKDKKLEWRLISAKGTHWFPKAATLKQVSLTHAQDIASSHQPVKASQSTVDGQGIKLVHAIQFAKGEHSATITGSVAQDSIQKYVLYARAGQKMTVKVDAIEDNATFQISMPEKEKFLPRAGKKDNAKSWAGELPVSGKYTIIVGVIRGNAAYTLEIAVDGEQAKSVSH